MGEFFKGWRRKLGVVALALACVLSAGWARSLVERDALIRINAHDTHGMVSADGCLQWARIWPDINYGPSRWLYRHDEIAKSSNQDQRIAVGLRHNDFDVHWNFTGWGLTFALNPKSYTWLPAHHSLKNTTSGRHPTGPSSYQ